MIEYFGVTLRYSKVELSQSTRLLRKGWYYIFNEVLTSLGAQYTMFEGIK